VSTLQADMDLAEVIVKLRTGHYQRSPSGLVKGPSG
jgi:hypothetical protein